MRLSTRVCMPPGPASRKTSQRPAAVAATGQARCGNGTPANSWFHAVAEEQVRYDRRNRERDLGRADVEAAGQAGARSRSHVAVGQGFRWHFEAALDRV